MESSVCCFFPLVSCSGTKSASASHIASFQTPTLSQHTSRTHASATLTSLQRMVSCGTVSPTATPFTDVLWREWYPVTFHSHSSLLMLLSDSSAPALFGNARPIYSARFNLERGGGRFPVYSSLEHKRETRCHISQQKQQRFPPPARVDVTVTVPASYPDLLPMFKLKLVKVSSSFLIRHNKH